MKFDILEIRVKNWDKMLDWFTTKVGLSLIVKEDDDKFALVGKDKVMFGVFAYKKNTRQRLVPYFKVGNLKNKLLKLEKNGVKVGKIEEKHWGKQAKILDPEKNEYYLYEEIRK